MPDWREIVSKGLSGLKLGAGEKEEVHAELAAHLEESYEVFCKEGLPEKEAVHRTFEQVADWQDLRREIFIAKRSGHPMQKRVQQLWTPGFLTMALSMIFLVTLQGLGFQARVVSWNGPRTTLLNLPWLLSLPFFGALGAYLSSRAGGSRRTVLLASTFPALALTGAFLSMFPIGFAMEQTLAQVADWQDLCRKIQIARTVKENLMNDRVRQLWLPGLLTFMLSTGTLALLQIFGPKPWVVALRGVLPVGLMYVPWLLSLPLVGAMGAFLSYRAGGSQRTVFSSIVFPVVPFLASILLVLPVSLIFDRFIAHNIAPMSLVMALLGWVLLPGVALLAGGLPAQFFFSRRLNPRRVVSG